MLILLLFYLSNRLVFFRALNREREKKSRKRDRDEVMKREKEGGRKGTRERERKREEGRKEKSELHFPACPATQSVLFQ